MQNNHLWPTACVRLRRSKDEASFLWLSTMRTPFNALTLLHNRNSIWLVTTCFSYPQKFRFGDLVQHVATSE